jgi:hypothetical protein
MEILKTVTGWLGELLKIMTVLFGIGIFAELIFGHFLGSFSVVSNFIAIVGNFGDKGFVGLIALLLLMGVMNKDK